MFDEAVRDLARKRLQDSDARRRPTPGQGESNILGPIGGIAGAILGGVSGGPAGALEGYSLGSTIGSAGDSLLSGKPMDAVRSLGPMGQPSEVETKPGVLTPDKKKSIMSKLFDASK